MKKIIYLSVLMLLPIGTSAALTSPRTSVIKLPTSTISTTTEMPVPVRTQIQIQPVDLLDPQPEPPTEINKLNPQPEPPSEINKLNPQPEPPLIDKLDPQPEPPMSGLKIGQILNTATNQNQIKNLQGFSFQEENIGTSKILKLQQVENVEIPLSFDMDNYRFKLVSKQIEIATSTLDFSSVIGKTPVIEIKLRNSSSSAPDMVKLKLVNNNALINFGQGEGEGQITLRSDFEVQEGKIILIEGENRIELRQNPTTFYRGLNLAMKDKGEVSDVELGVQDGKPIYDIKTKLKAKLFGIFEAPLKTNMRVRADNNSIEAVDKPWYAVFYAKPDLSKLVFKPDFAVTKIELPAIFKKGDSVTAKITITNKGTATGFSLFNTKTGVCHEIELYWDNYFIKKTCIVFIVDPGESYTFEQKFEAQCKPIKAHFDSAQSLEDSNYSNNVMTVQTNCTD